MVRNLYLYWKGRFIYCACGRSQGSELPRPPLTKNVPQLPAKFVKIL